MPERWAWRSSWDNSDKSRAVHKARVSHECGVGYCRRQRFRLDGFGDERPAHVTFMGLTNGPLVPKLVFVFCLIILTVWPRKYSSFSIFLAPVKMFLKYFLLFFNKKVTGYFTRCQLIWISKTKFKNCWIKMTSKTKCLCTRW